MKRKILSILMVFMIATSGMAFANTIKPIITVDSNAEIPTFTAGKEYTLEIPLDNISKYTAKDVIAKITTDPDKLPFLVDKAVFSDRLLYVRYGVGDSAKIDVTVSPSAKTQIYKIDLEFLYTNTDGDDFTSTGSYYVKIVNKGIEPTLGVMEYSFSDDNLVAGVDDGLLVTIANKGTVDAYNIRVKLEGFEKDGVQLSSDVDTKDILKIEGGEDESVAYSIIASPDAKSDTYGLTAKMSYTDEFGVEYESESTIYVPVEGKDSDSIELDVKNLTAPERIKAGEPYNISFDLENIGLLEAEKAVISIKYPEDFIPVDSPKKIIKNFKPGDTNSFEFQFLAKQEAKTKFDDFYVKVEYYASISNSEDLGSFEEYCGVMVDGRSGLGRPKIIVKDYEIVDNTVAMAGQEFVLKVNFFNTSSSDIVKNIKVSMQSDDGVFSPVDSSSSFFINNIGREGNVEKLLKFKTKTDAAVKVYNLTLTMEYEDGEGNAYDSQEQAYKEEEKLGIQVSQPVRLETAEPVLPMEAYIGSPADIELEFYNMGKSTMYNMMVKLEGNFQVQGSNYFVGNFESGRSEYFSATMIPEEEGEAKGKIIFEFEDALGNIEKVEKEISYFVMAEGAGENFDENMEFPEGGFNEDGFEEPDGNNKNKLIGFGVAAVILLAGGINFL